MAVLLILMWKRPIHIPVSLSFSLSLYKGPDPIMMTSPSRHDHPSQSKDSSSNTTHKVVEPQRLSLGEIQSSPQLFARALVHPWDPCTDQMSPRSQVLSVINTQTPGTIIVLQTHARCVLYHPAAPKFRIFISASKEWNDTGMKSGEEENRVPWCIHLIILINKKSGIRYRVENLNDQRSEEATS